MFKYASTGKVRVSILVNVVLAVIFCFSQSNATYSIIATDSATRQVGGAVTSCVGNISVSIVLGFVPDLGVLAMQARVDPFSLSQKTKAIEGLANKLDLTSIMSGLNTDADLFLSDRQYALVNFEAVSNMTGKSTESFSNHLPGSVDEFKYSIQGNMLTSEKVLIQAESSFLESGNLSERLVRALEAGGANGEGDRRCTPNGRPSDSAYLRVDNADGSIFVELEVIGSQNQLEDLRDKYIEWEKSK